LTNLYLNNGIRNKKIEKDIFAGRLDVLGKQAEAEFITGRTEPL